MNDSHDRHNTGKIARTLAEQPRYAIATNNEAARIVCVGGADLGAEFTLSTDDIIGRSSSCSIIFNETSVSRQHAQIYREGNLYYLIDKNSANGTFVNHQRISKQILQNGDEINFGNAMFRFIAPGEIYKRDPLLKNDIPAANVIVKESTRDRSAFTTASSAESSVLSYVLISVVILLIAAVIALGIIYLRRQDLPTPRATAANYFASGVTAMQKRQWEKAQSQFNIFLTLEPANQAGQRYLKKIEREKSFERQLLAARSALAGGELLLAYNQASSILDSAYTTEAKILLNKINKQLNSNIDEAKNAINAGKYNDAIKLLTIVDAIRPGHAEVTNLLERARTGGHKRSTSTKSVSTQTSLLDDAVKYFNSGNYDTAIAKAKASSSKRSAAMVANIEKFKLIIADAKIEYVAKRADTAIREYELAKSLAKKIGSPANSSVRQNINKNLADMYYVRGIDRWLAQDYNDALTNFRSALANDNSHTPTRNKIDEMRKHAGDFYNEAEKIYNSNPKRAKSLYRLVMQLLPASDDRYRQSARRIDANP
ncbi:MAG: FHA domain-containing protein [Deltaproteobacteria bacterium]|nr:FHA domain-containing protein [Deltaproteobacteria bacterium]